MSRMVRVELPAHLRTLAKVSVNEVAVEVAGAVTLRGVVDALELQYPGLRGTIREPSGKRRAFLRFFAAEEDLSHEGMDAVLPEAVADGREALLVVGAVAGGAVDTHEELAGALAGVRTESGKTLLELAESSPVLLVFLRHFGCSFCRKAISDVAELQGQLAARGVRPVFVHLGTPELAKHYFDYYGLSDVERVSDPDALVYRMPVFALGRQHPAMQLVSPKVWFGWLKGTIFKHGIGMIREDGSQMPGIFYLKDGKIARRFIYKTIADEPDYLKLAA